MIKPRILSGHQQDNFWRILLQFGLFSLLFILASCGPSSPAPEERTPTVVTDEAAAETASTATTESVELPATEPALSEAEIGYPPPAILPEPTNVDEPYPPERPAATPTPEVYPPQEEYLEPRFRIDTPLKVGDRVVSGQAPPDMELAIISVTFNGQLLGTGSSSADNTFSIAVPELQEGHLIGITFAELEPGLDYVGMTEKYFPHRGDGFINLPNVGVILESVQVEP